MLGGLMDVEEGLAMLQTGNVHAEKLVYRIADTPAYRRLRKGGGGGESLRSGSGYTQRKTLAN